MNALPMHNFILQNRKKMYVLFFIQICFDNVHMSEDVFRDLHIIQMYICSVFRGEHMDNPVTI